MFDVFIDHHSFVLLSLICLLKKPQNIFIKYGFSYLNCVSYKKLSLAFDCKLYSDLSSWNMLTLNHSLLGELATFK